MSTTSSPSLESWLDALASASPTPGGGGASALGGAAGAALVSMVANLTLARDLDRQEAAPLQELRQESQALRQQLTRLISDDARAYDAVIAAYRLPRDTALARQARREAIQSALRGATTVPLEIAECCLRVVALAECAAHLGLRAAVTDAGAAAHLAEGSARAVLLNVDINLASLRDEVFAASARARADRLKQALPQQLEAALAAMEARLSSSDKKG